MAGKVFSQNKNWKKALELSLAQPSIVDRENAEEKIIILSDAIFVDSKNPLFYAKRADMYLYLINIGKEKKIQHIYVMRYYANGDIKSSIINMRQCLKLQKFKPKKSPNDPMYSIIPSFSPITHLPSLGIQRHQDFLICAL